MRVTQPGIASRKHFREDRNQLAPPDIKDFNALNGI